MLRVMVYFSYKTSPRTSAAPILMRKKVVTLRSRRRENGGRGGMRARNFRQFGLIKPFQGCPDRVSSNVIFLCVSQEKISFNSLYAPREKQWEGKTSELFKENLAEPGRPRSNKDFSYPPVRCSSKLCLTLSRRLCR